MPTLDGVAAKTKSIIQRADHFCSNLLAIARLFYGERVGKKWFESFYQMLKAEYGEQNNLVGYLGEALPQLRFVRYTRDAVEHPTENARAVIKNFELKASGEIFLPSIEVIHDKTPQSQVSVVKLFQQLTDNLSFIFEGLVVSMCETNIRPFGGMNVGIDLLPEERRRIQNVRYSYFVFLGGRWVPFG